MPGLAALAVPNDPARAGDYPREYPSTAGYGAEI